MGSPKPVDELDITHTHDSTKHEMMGGVVESTTANTKSDEHL
jgi:hypothetical protein